MRISVVIPTLNEAERVAGVLHHLSQLNGVHELLLVDGGSHDQTLDIARRVTAAWRADVAAPRVRLLSSPASRARQQNLGAAQATGDVLLFIHADTKVPRDTAYWVRRCLRSPRVVAGAFRTWHVDDRPAPPGRAGRRSRPRAPWLHLADIRSRYTSLPYGDQGLFLTRSVFQRVGGFPEQPLMEDLELSIRLRRLGKICVAPARIEVSGRRFLNSPWLDTLLVNAFPALYRAGVSPERLKQLYRDLR